MARLGLNKCMNERNKMKEVGIHLEYSYNNKKIFFFFFSFFLNEKNIKTKSRDK